MNGVADSTVLSASIPDSVQTDTQTVALDAAGGIQGFPAGSFSVQIANPDNSSQTFPIANVVLDAGSVTSIIAAGSFAGGTQTGFTAEESLTSPAAGQTLMQIADAALQGSSGRMLRFSFTALPGSTGSSLAQSDGVTFAQAGMPFTLSAGKYEIAVSSYPICVAGQACTQNVALLFDSGPAGINLPDASNGAGIFQLVALDATSAQQNSAGASITLLLLDNNNGSTLLLNGKN